MLYYVYDCNLEKRVDKDGEGIERDSNHCGKIDCGYHLLSVFLTF